MFPRFCAICQRYVSSGNHHCEICNSCTSKVSILPLSWVTLLAAVVFFWVTVVLIDSMIFALIKKKTKQTYFDTDFFGKPRQFNLVVFFTGHHNLMGINFYFLIPLWWKEDWKSYLLATETIPYAPVLCLHILFSLCVGSCRSH